MRIAHTGDLHLSNRGTVAGRYVLRQGVNLNLWDRIGALSKFCDYVEENETDLIVIAGDLFDSSNPENVAIKVAVDTIERLSEQAPVVIVKGNHDGGKGSELATALAPFGKSQRRNGIYVSDRPEIIPIISKQRVIQVFTLPYPRKSALITSPQYKNLSPEELSRFVGFKMEEILAGYAAQLDRSALNVLVGHFTVASGMYSKEQAVPPFDISIREEFLEKFDLALLGHLHEPQRFYSGTIGRSGFGEEGMKVGFKVHEVHYNEAGEKLGIDEQFIELPGRRYVTLKADEFLMNGTGLLSDLNDETVIRIKGKVTKADHDQIVRKMRELRFPFLKNAVEIESETVRVDGPGGISQEPTLEEALRLWGEGKQGVEKFINKLAEAAKEIEYEWLTEKEGT
jgi:exonuclease SbcD